MQTLMKSQLKIDKLTAGLLIILMLIIGITIGQLAFHIDWDKIAKNAHADFCMKTCKERLAKEGKPFVPNVKKDSKTTIATTKAKSKVVGTKLVTTTTSTTQQSSNMKNFIAIELNDSCLHLSKQNLSSRCPPSKDLEKFDTTDQKTSGKFDYDKNGFYHRGKASYTNYELSYPSTQYPLVVCVDCSTTILGHAKKIFVGATDFVYTKKSERKISNNTRYEYYSRYVDACNEARVSWNPSLIEDTIHYLDSGCRSTSFDEKSKVQTPLSKLTYNGQHYQYIKWLEDAKKSAKESADAYCKKEGSKCSK